MRHVSSLFSLLYWMCKILLIMAFVKIYLAPAFASERILFIGDSHSVSDFYAPFGKRMEANMAKLPNTTVDFYASCGSIVKSWYVGFKSPCGYVAHPSQGERIAEKFYPAAKVENLINEVKPTFAIIELSGNYVNVDPSFDVVQDVRRLAKRIHEAGAKCLWVTMPDSRKFPDRPNDIVPKIKEGVSDYCEIFESHKVTKYPTNAPHGADGVHYSFGSPTADPSVSGYAVAYKWADLVFAKVKEMMKN